MIMPITGQMGDYGQQVCDNGYSSGGTMIMPITGQMGDYGQQVCDNGVQAGGLHFGFLEKGDDFCNVFYFTPTDTDDSTIDISTTMENMESNLSGVKGDYRTGSET